MKVEYHPSTVADLNAAISHYDRQRAGLGSLFRAEVYALIDRVIEDPQLYAEVKGVRRALVKRFPYSVVYRLMPDERIRVLMIRHHKRHPEHGAQRS